MAVVAVAINVADVVVIVALVGVVSRLLSYLSLLLSFHQVAFLELNRLVSHLTSTKEHRTRSPPDGRGGSSSGSSSDYG